MLVIGGLVFLLLCVFGSFAASGGAIVPLVMSMPFELLTILGAGIGTFLMANSMSDLKHVPGAFKVALKGPSFGRQDYLDLLGLMFFFTRLAQSQGAMALEPHIETPMESTAFANYPKIRDNNRVRNLICDYLRMISMNMDDPFQFDEVMTRELAKNLKEDTHVAHGLQSLSDALPALGIVAAVLGVIKTMGSISKPPEVLGEMIAGALSGTFLGVLLAYGMVGPFAARMQSVVEEDASYYDLIRVVLVAFLQGNAPQVSVEIGRKDIPVPLMPSFEEVDTAISELAIG
ncbi:flagellar motor stator protein MotA [Acetobacter oeni]|uniref:Flagellar motor protein MotA n=1 Tax=Acetobacter oeni TaxID=304077 RepID=A0A511XG38_9PROT|nr:flagellar motor stator protein MotA [Acetobacter oeni]MBB3882168.1 chemotaxis protein MotA [Acetobacter oeni]NHO17926.1 flagellar motor stator protein MotA [Acetobacter oeni]GBR01459.1 flagellar motor protein MotA [Acetobacter oeni LMG 21952]GEN61912.1 flagellar motor protein MotA [Acetobacter oeni]